MTTDPAQAAPTRSFSIWRSTPLRLGLMLAAVFTLCGIVTFAGAYVVVRADRIRAIEANLDQHVASFSAARLPLALGAQVAADAAATDARDRIFAYISPLGPRVGNAAVEVQDDGVLLSPLPGRPPLSRDGYLSRVVPMAGGLLIVAETRTPLVLVRRTFLILAAVGLLPTALAAFLSGYALARRADRRMREVETALDRLAAGDLSARVPDRRTGLEDLDLIADRVNRMARAQEAATASLRQVTTDIAHDLKTPVQRIAVLLHRLRDDHPEGSAATLAEAALNEAERAAGMFQGLLTIAEIEGAGGGDPAPLIDLGQIAATLAEVFEPAAAETGHRLLLDLPPGPARIRGDRALVGRMVSNLLDNALRHTPDGTEVTLSVRVSAGGITLGVADRGPGIPPEERARVVQRLYRLDRSRNTPGHGLGLSLVAAIAGRHGAELSLGDNDPGLRIEVMFPHPPAAG
ncbi:sensor histidine kinase [Halodurantibacterium flavum]|uniref:histidine kinase n=1 Tax=Halodurantibacterium flavum TaxID=1382802 RepID=A0ABW4S637_9RHOB